MTELEALVGLNMVGDIGGIRLKKLFAFFEKPQKILDAPVEKLSAVSGIGEKIATQIHALNKKDIERELNLVRHYKLKMITQADHDYPEQLKNIYDPPIVLYLKGSLKTEDKLSLAIVGSRRASFYGLSSAEKFASALSGYGFTIISGMARGIDTTAHKGALKSGGRTIAVMGSGFNHIYPPENKELTEAIAKNGAVISEFPLDTKPLQQNFPRRNRTISGLSLGVLVVEAARNSGALITADFALEQGREVFALPGKVDSGTSFGTNGLIKQGAKLVSGIEDILEEFNLPIDIDPRVKDSGNQSCQQSSGADLVEQDRLLYHLISSSPIQLDELIEKTNLDISELSSMLLRLQMKKLIRQLPGKQFVKY